MYKFIFAFYILAFFYCSCLNIPGLVLAQQHQNDDTLVSPSNTPTTVSMNNNNEPDPATITSSPKTLPTNYEDIGSNNNYDSESISASLITTTTSVLTHFSMPSRAASSSTSSSFHPIPSAPYPDDVVGKHGPLHVSSANNDSNILYQGIVALVLIVSSTLLLVKSL